MLRSPRTCFFRWFNNPSFTIVSFNLAIKRSICCHTSVSLQKWLSCLYQYVNERGLFYYSKTNFQISFLPPGIFVPDCSRDPVKPVEWTKKAVCLPGKPMPCRASSSVCYFAYKNLAGFCRSSQTAGLVLVTKWRITDSNR